MRKALQALFAFFTVAALFSHIRAELVKSYEVSGDSTIPMPIDCDIVSGSVTIVSCPLENKFTVYLSEMLLNTTIAEIENEVQGVDDKEEVRYDPEDYIRFIEIENVNITSVRKSMEKTYDKYVNSVIVIFVNNTQTNTTDNDNDDWEWQHSVWRYWQNPDSFWIESEYLFDTQKEKRVFYNEIEVFDNYAIGYEAGDPDDDEKQDLWTVIFFKNYMADLVPDNFHVQAYKQEGANVAGYSYWDQDGKGNYDMIVLVQYSGSIVVTPVNMVISHSSFNVRFSASTSQTYMKVNTIVSKIDTPSQLLVIGCESCLNGYGQIFFFDAQNLNLTYTLEGDKNAQEVGRNIVYRSNTGYSEQFWYTSYKSNRITLNSIVFFKKSGNDYWEQKKDENLLVVDGTSDTDELIFTSIDDSFLYKLNSNTTLWTFLSCNYNKYYFTEDADKNDGREPMLDNRNCTRCDRRTPFSYGFNKDECKSCDELVGFVKNADEYIQYFYNEACGDYQACDQSNTCDDGTTDDVTTTFEDDFAGTDDVYVGEVQVTEEEEGSSGQIILYLLIIFIILVLIIVGYIFYKRRQVSNVQTKVHNIGRKHKKQARHQESDIPNIQANAESSEMMEGMPVSKPKLDQEGQPQDARFDTNQSIERVNYGTNSKNNSHRKMVQDDGTSSQEILTIGLQETNTAPSQMVSLKPKHDKKNTSESGYVEPVSTMMYQGVGPADGSARNKQERAQQKGESMLPGIGGGNKGSFITPGSRVEDNTAVDLL